MSEPLIIKNSISIRAPKAKVWDALVNPEQTKKYMYGCEPISDWKTGSELLWQGVDGDKSITFVKGKIIAIRPEEYLAYTVIDPNNTEVPDIPENYLTVTYTLEENNGETRCSVTQGDYSTVANGQGRYDDTMKVGGWQSILDAIKSLVEEGKPLDVVPE
ncbi:MAG TPA: SRPBCC domain-containing protein [Saprospiraceae bacterium]|nr:SRPBCC domain-containing protein [Saprospiraceae bacterium]